MDVVIIDCQNDFVSGSLACHHAEEAVKNIAALLNQEKLNVFYTADSHPENHMSFEKEGGIWPVHCVANTEGAEIHLKLQQSNNPPSAENTYLKGRDEKVEEYSGYHGQNNRGEELKDAVSDKVFITGIASEFCVRETALDLKKDGKEVIVLKDYLGYVDHDNHLKNLEELEEHGIKVQ